MFKQRFSSSRLEYLNGQKKTHSRSKIVSPWKEEILTRRQIIQHCHKSNWRASNHLSHTTHAYEHLSTERPPTWSRSYIDSQPTVAAVADPPTNSQTGALPVTSPPSWSLIRAIASDQSTRSAVVARSGDDFTELGNTRRTRSPFPGSADHSALTCIIP